MLAKHNASMNTFSIIMDAAARGDDLHLVSNATLLDCSRMYVNPSLSNLIVMLINHPVVNFWFHFFRLSECSELVKNQEHINPEIGHAAGRLKQWAMENDFDPATFELVSQTGPPHNRIFVISCKKDDHVTTGMFDVTYYYYTILFVLTPLFFRRRKVEKGCKESSCLSHDEHSRN